MLLGSIFTLPTTPGRKSGQANTLPFRSSSGQETASDFTLQLKETDRSTDQ